jgi:hypothetical protein
MIFQFGLSGLIWLRTVMRLPTRKVRFTLPEPEYVPGATTTTSPLLAALMPDCIVGYVREGTEIVAAAAAP